MENYINAIIAGSIWILTALFFWKVYPIIKDNAVFKKAMEFVRMVEEDIGAGSGGIKFDNAVGLLQEWVDKLGWKIDVSVLMDTVTAAVGALHAEQGKAPVKKADTPN